MNPLTKPCFLLLTAAILVFTGSSCRKENLTPGSAEVVLPGGVISVIPATTMEAGVYIVNACPKGGKLDSAALATLPAAITDYLTVNYPGYTFQKAFKALSASGTADSYAVVIVYNGKPVGLKFSTEGTFISVFEQREGRDLKNKGWHPGGRFDARDGRCRDTLAIAAIPAAIKTYFAGNYAQDTLLHALANKDGSVIVISANKGLFASVFSAAGTFIKRAALAEPFKRSEIDRVLLPPVAQTYLTVTFAGYVFNKAYVLKSGTTVKGYVALIDASGTKYAVLFDANGARVKTIVVR